MNLFLNTYDDVCDTFFYILRGLSTKTNGSLVDILVGIHCLGLQIFLNFEALKGNTTSDIA